MNFEWDRRKAKTNRVKHGVDFADAVAAFYDDEAVTIVDDSVEEEERFITLGSDALGRIVVVVYVWRDESIRIISTRKATHHECRTYEEG